jgi:hypothetical protein
MLMHLRMAAALFPAHPASFGAGSDDSGQDINIAAGTPRRMGGDHFPYAHRHLLEPPQSSGE